MSDLEKPQGGKLAQITSDIQFENDFGQEPIGLGRITQYMEVLPMMVKNPSESIVRYRWLAYGFEAIICFLRFPPYEGGVNAVIEDAPNWDASLIDWWLLVLFVVTMFSFEAVFALIRNVRANLS